MVARFVPYFTETIVPDLRAGKTVLIAAHGNSLRALVKYLDGMSDDDVVGLNIPTGIPLRYDLDGEPQPESRRRHISGSRGGRGRRGRRSQSGCEIVHKSTISGKHRVNAIRTPALECVTCPVLAARCWDDVHQFRTICS